MQIRTSRISITLAQVARLSGAKIARHLKALDEGDDTELDVVLIGTDSFAVQDGSRHRLMACRLAGLLRVPARIIP